MKSDDSSLTAEQLRAIEAPARELLDRADAWRRFPTPVEDILQAANLRVASHSIFDPGRILEFIRGKTAAAADTIKSALSKVFGIYDAHAEEIHIDDNFILVKKQFLKLHETGHHKLPWHRRIFRVFQDCEKTLSPDVAELFDREANNFARYLLFQGAGYAELAADCTMGIKTPIQLAKKFGASNYASAREFARTNHRACVVYVLEPLQYIAGQGMQGVVRRIEPSPSFLAQFGWPADEVISSRGLFGRALPIGRRMSKPTPVELVDLNGTRYECLAEAFDTTFNVLLLVYPIQALTKTTIILPATYQPA